MCLCPLSIVSLRSTEPVNGQRQKSFSQSLSLLSLFLVLLLLRDPRTDDDLSDDPTMNLSDAVDCGVLLAKRVVKRTPRPWRKKIRKAPGRRRRRWWRRYCGRSAAVPAIGATTIPLLLLLLSDLPSASVCLAVRNVSCWMTELALFAALLLALRLLLLL